MRTGRARRCAGPLLGLVLALGACGYSLRGTLPEHLQTVAVPVFSNRTLQPGVENVLTRAVIEAFATNGRLRVVAPEQADAILEGEVTGYEVHSIAFDPEANVRQYRVVLTMNLRFRDLVERQVLLERQGYRERADFRVSAAVSQTIASEQLALQAAAGDLARAIVAQALARF